jgi:hypothetical protein
MAAEKRSLPYISQPGMTSRHVMAFVPTLFCHIAMFEFPTVSSAFERLIGGVNVF